MNLIFYQEDQEPVLNNKHDYVTNASSPRWPLLQLISIYKIPGGSESCLEITLYKM